jgi:hypothetical protein
VIALLCWLFVAPWLFLLDGVLAEVSPVRIDLGVPLCLVFALYCRTTALPALLFGAALGRALLEGGGLPLWFLAMGLPVAALLPLRTVFVERAPLWQCTAAGFLALCVPRVATFFGRFAADPFAPLAPLGGVVSVLLAMVLAPLLAVVLRRLPPLGRFAEVRR